MPSAIPIVIVAFGTTTAAIETYRFMDERFRRRFDGHPIHWAYTSRIVRDRLSSRLQTPVKDPCSVLQDLHAKGHEWAVVQSLHMICGHEFYRLVEEVRDQPIRTSIGLPLLSSPDDYQRVAFAVGMVVGFRRDEAVVLVGHGTDHPAWCAYPTLEAMVKEVWGVRAHVGVIDGQPGLDHVLRAVLASGVPKVRIFPLLLVAGNHFIKDLSHGDDCWKAILQRHGLDVILETRGLGYDENIVGLFTDHTAQAMDVIGGH